MAAPTSKKGVHIAKIIIEHRNACKKHPKFCDFFFHKDAAWDLTEINLKKGNSSGPQYADSILFEEIVEAMVAYENGELEHCIQELAQCGAVVLRMMQFVRDEIRRGKYEIAH